MAKPYYNPYGDPNNNYAQPKDMTYDPYGDPTNNYAIRKAAEAGIGNGISNTNPVMNPPPSPMGNQIQQTQPQQQPQQQNQPQQPEYDPIKEAESAKNRAITQTNTAYDEDKKLREQQKASELARLKAILDSRKSAITSSISGARNKFQPQREQVDVRRAQDLARAREILAAQGIMGGDNLTTQMDVNTGASQQMAEVDQTQDDYVRNLEQESRNLEGAYDADVASQMAKQAEMERESLLNKANSIANAENSYATNLQNALKAKQEREEALRIEKKNDSRFEQQQKDLRYGEMGMVLDPATGEYTKTPSQIEKERKSAGEAEADRIKKYVDTISQFSGNYQQRINDVLGDNDPSNDWEVSYLKTAQADKKSNMFQNDIKNISQYSNNYQAEINRRTETLDGEDDKLIPYLEMARQGKIASLAEAKKKQEEEIRKREVEDRKYELDRQKTQHDINKPYYKESSGDSTKEKNDRVKDYSAVIADEMYSKDGGLDYTKFANYMEKLISRGESKDVIDLLSRKWNFDEDTYSATKTNTNLAGLMGYR
jgi:hypothetical protein